MFFWFLGIYWQFLHFTPKLPLFELKIQHFGYFWKKILSAFYRCPQSYFLSLYSLKKKTKQWRLNWVFKIHRKHWFFASNFNCKFLPYPSSKLFDWKHSHNQHCHTFKTSYVACLALKLQPKTPSGPHTYTYSSQFSIF